MNSNTVTRGLPIEPRPFEPLPIELTSDKVLIRPLKLEDSEAFFQAGNYPELWRWVQPNHCQSLVSAQQWVTDSIEQQSQGLQIPFAIIDRASGAFIGSTRYCSIRIKERGIEIGHTFIKPKYQRTFVNSHCKFLLLQHAFETLEAIRVELKTHENNHQSRNAIGRLGATFEGIIRNHRILPDGSVRNTAIFSITDQQWPAAKQGLQHKMMTNHNYEFEA